MRKMDDEVSLNNVIPKPVFGFDFSTLMLFRCTKRVWAEQFQKGQIYFGSPQEWITLEEKGKKGQGDLLEGAFLSCKEDDHSDFIQNLKANPSLVFFPHNGFLFFRRKTVLSLRCLCLYGLRSNAFGKETGPDGRARYYTKITKSYFSDFTDITSREEYDNANPNEQPVVIRINNPHAFFSRIRSFLFNLGVKEEEFIISPVEYLDKNTQMIAAIPSPSELLLKDKTFEEQSEIRIIVNSSSPKYLDYIHKHSNVLSIGSLEDITEIYDYYFDDMSIERYGSKSFLFSLPKPINKQIDEMDFFELEDLLFNILRGTVQLKEVPDECDTWDKKLKFLADLFYTKYGVLLHVDENKNVFLYNIPQELLNQSHKRNKPLEQRAQFEKEIEELLNKKRYNVATETCLKSCEDKSLFPIANFYLGKVYSMEGKDQNAIDAFLKSFNNDHKRIESLDGIAAIYFRRGEYRKAIEIYKSIQDEKGYDGRIWCNIGICFIRLKQYNMAVEHFDKGIDFDQTDAFPYYNKGVACFMMGQYDQAKACMEKAIELDPKNEIYKREYSKCFPPKHMQC